MNREIEKPTEKPSEQAILTYLAQLETICSTYNPGARLIGSRKRCAQFTLPRNWNKLALMRPADTNLLRTFDPPRKVYFDIDPDWRLIESWWRAEYLVAGKFGVDDGGVWQMFSLSENACADPIIGISALIIYFDWDRVV